MKRGVEPIFFSLLMRRQDKQERALRLVKVPTLFSTLKIEDTAYHVSRRAYYNPGLPETCY